MDWLKDHEFLATWLALLVAVGSVISKERIAWMYALTKTWVRKALRGIKIFTMVWFLIMNAVMVFVSGVSMGERLFHGDHDITNDFRVLGECWARLRGKAKTASQGTITGCDFQETVLGFCVMKPFAVIAAHTRTVLLVPEYAFR